MLHNSKGAGASNDRRWASHQLTFWRTSSAYVHAVVEVAQVAILFLTCGSITKIMAKKRKADDDGGAAGAAVDVDDDVDDDVEEEVGDDADGAADGGGGRLRGPKKKKKKAKKMNAMSPEELAEYTKAQARR